MGQCCVVQVIPWYWCVLLVRTELDLWANVVWCKSCPVIGVCCCSERSWTCGPMLCGASHSLVSVCIVVQNGAGSVGQCCVVQVIPWYWCVLLFRTELDLWANVMWCKSFPGIGVYCWSGRSWTCGPMLCGASHSLVLVCIVVQNGAGPVGQCCVVQVIPWYWCVLLVRTELDLWANVVWCKSFPGIGVYCCSELSWTCGPMLCGASHSLVLVCIVGQDGAGPVGQCCVVQVMPCYWCVLLFRTELDLWANVVWCKSFPGIGVYCCSERSWICGPMLCDASHSLVLVCIVVQNGAGPVGQCYVVQVIPCYWCVLLFRTELDLWANVVWCKSFPGIGVYCCSERSWTCGPMLCGASHSLVLVCIVGHDGAGPVGQCCVVQVIPWYWCVLLFRTELDLWANVVWCKSFPGIGVYCCSERSWSCGPMLCGASHSLVLVCIVVQNGSGPVGQCCVVQVIPWYWCVLLFRTEMDLWANVVWCKSFPGIGVYCCSERSWTCGPMLCGASHSLVLVCIVVQNGDGPVGQCCVVQVIPWYWCVLLVRTELDLWANVVWCKSFPGIGVYCCSERSWTCGTMLCGASHSLVLVCIVGQDGAGPVGQCCVVQVIPWYWCVLLFRTELDLWANVVWCKSFPGIGVYCCSEQRWTCGPMLCGASHSLVLVCIVVQNGDGPVGQCCVVQVIPWYWCVLLFRTELDLWANVVWCKSFPGIGVCCCSERSWTCGPML